MEHLAPLIQTVLWVGLIAGIVWKFYEPIYGLLTALQKRVESGSNIKVGPLELTEQLKPQPPAEQLEKAAAEVREAIQEGLPEQTAHATLNTTPANLQARYFQAEDLVLRAIQNEYGATISRQVTAGSDNGFDGVFTSNDRINIIEVKYARSLKSMPRFKDSILRLNATIAAYGWQNAQIILAVVFEDSNDVAKGQELLAKVAGVSSVPLVVKCYSYGELNLKFGMDEQGRGQV